MVVCTHDGHVEYEPEGQYCPHHGTPLLRECPKCGEPWKIVNMSMTINVGADFCDSLRPSRPWVSREKRLAWIKGRLHTQKLDQATELETA